MIKFETGGYSSNLIKEVTIEKESEKSIWREGRSRLKRSSYRNYFDTWEQAEDWLRGEEENNVKLCQTRLDYAKENQSKIDTVLKREAKEYFNLKD